MCDEQTAAVPTIPGLDLAEGFYRDEVAPILEREFPRLRYTAGLIGYGSEVLGFDDRMSTDHHWGPRVMLFLAPETLQADGARIRCALGSALPRTYRGYSTHWSEPDPDDGGVQHPETAGDGPVNHRVELHSVAGFLTGYLGVDARQALRTEQWLSLPWQKLRSVTAGRLFRDDLGLAAVREALAWYPRDVWVYVLAAAWSRLGEEEHLTGRAGWVGDEVGSALIAGRLVRDCMRLAFLMARVYPPYTKWFGTAFRQLPCAARLTPLLAGVLQASSWQERDPLLGQLYRALVKQHNALGLTAPLDPDPRPFWGRPFTVIDGERLATALTEQISDPQVVRLARRRLIGPVDLFSDSTDLLEDVSRFDAVSGLWT